MAKRSTNSLAPPLLTKYGNQGTSNTRTHMSITDKKLPTDLGEEEEEEVDRSLSAFSESGGVDR